MRIEVLMRAMEDSISEVLETMFFLPVDTVTPKKIETLPALKTINHLLARLSFKGPVSGYSQLYIPMALSEEVAMDFLGATEENIGESEIDETVKEMINMIVGNLLSRYDEDAVFDMGIPTLIPVDQPLFLEDPFQSGLSVEVMTLNSRLILYLFTKENSS